MNAAVIYVSFIMCAVYVLELMFGHYYPAYLTICKKRTRNDYCIYDKYWQGETRFDLNEADCACGTATSTRPASTAWVDPTAGSRLMAVPHHARSCQSGPESCLCSCQTCPRELSRQFCSHRLPVAALLRVAPDMPGDYHRAREPHGPEGRLQRQDNGSPHKRPGAKPELDRMASDARLSHAALMRGMGVRQRANLPILCGVVTGTDALTTSRQLGRFPSQRQTAAGGLGV